jgi:hypothetical protein
MTTLEVTEIAAVVSEAVCDISSGYTRVARVLPGTGKRRTVEIVWDDTPRGNPFDIDAFWPNEDCPLSADEKLTYFWQYHRSVGCDQFTAILANVFKSLCDAGISLVHNKQPVVDILALNCVEFDVSDILSSPDNVLHLHDPVTNTTLPVIATNATMEQMYNMGPEVCTRLGKHLPEDASKTWGKMKQHLPESYNSTLPHWWLAVVVKGDRNKGEKERKMVHLDLCGAAYDPSSLVRAPRSETMVSLKVFTTPEYLIRPNLDPELSHKLILTPVLGESNNISLLPKSVRHFRCYHKERKKVNVTAASIEVTPLGEFIERRPFDDAKNAKISEIIQTLQNNHLESLLPGTEVVVCNIQSRPELNGRHGMIKEVIDKDRVGSDRIPVLVSGMRKPISLKPSCIQLPPKKPYRTLEELKKMDIDEETEEAIKKQASEGKQQYDSLTEKQKSQINKKLEDPCVIKVLQALQSMQASFTNLADPEYKRGIEALIQFPLSTILPPGALGKMRQSFELSNHPKAGVAIQIINLLKTAKQRYVSEHPECLQLDGGVAILPGSEIERVSESVVKRIKSDTELAYVFERLEVLGLFRNPAK